MTVRDAGAGNLGLAKTGRSVFKVKALRKMLDTMTVAEKEPVAETAVKGKVSPAPSRTVTLSNGMVLKMVRRDVYNRVVRGRAA